MKQALWLHRVTLAVPTAPLSERLWVAFNLLSPTVPRAAIEAYQACRPWEPDGESRYQEWRASAEAATGKGCPDLREIGVRMSPSFRKGLDDE